MRRGEGQVCVCVCLGGWGGVVCVSLCVCVEGGIGERTYMCVMCVLGRGRGVRLYGLCF